MAKFNVGTVLRSAFLRGLTGAAAALPAELDVHAATGSHGPADVLEAGKAAMAEAVRNLIRSMAQSPRSLTSPGCTGRCS